MTDFSRRNFLHLAGAGALAGTAGRGLFAEQQYPPAVPAPSIYPYAKRATVSLVQGEERRKNVCEALLAIDDQIKPLLQAKKYVVIKPNIVDTRVPLAATHADALLGIMDYLAPRFKGPVDDRRGLRAGQPGGFREQPLQPRGNGVQVAPGQPGGSEPGGEIRGLLDRRCQHPAHPRPAGREARGPGCLHCVLGHAQDAQRRGGHACR